MHFSDYIGITFYWSPNFMGGGVLRDDGKSSPTISVVQKWDYVFLHYFIL